MKFLQSPKSRVISEICSSELTKQGHLYLHDKNLPLPVLRSQTWIITPTLNILYSKTCKIIIVIQGEINHWIKIYNVNKTARPRWLSFASFLVSSRQTGSEWIHQFTEGNYPGTTREIEEILEICANCNSPQMRLMTSIEVLGKIDT